MGYLDSYEDDELWPVWRPIVGTLAGVVLVLFIAAAALGNHDDLPADRGTMLFYATGRMLLIYAFIYWAALRQRGLAWKIGAFVALWVASAFFTMVQVGTEMKGLRQELAAMRGDMSAALGGKQLDAKDADEKTIAGTVHGLVAALQSDQRAFQAEVDATGAAGLASPAALKKHPELLSNCGKIAALSGRTEFYHQQWVQRIADARARIGRINQSAEMREGMLEGFDQALNRNRGNVEQSFTLQAQQLTEMASLCSILARRHWRESHGVFGFTSASDLAEYQAVAQRFDSLGAQITELERERQARAQTSLQGMDRMLNETDPQR